MKKVSKVCTTFKNLYYSKKRISIEQGGTRSGKTYSILQILIYLSYINKNLSLVFGICKKTTIDLRRTVMREFFQILVEQNLYDIKKHNKTEKTYWLFGNLFEFMSFDEEQKAKGTTIDVLFVNECDGFGFNTIKQLFQRTKRKIILDYNPSQEFWIYDNFIDIHGYPMRDDVEFHKTTYKDNPFLLPEQIEFIESYKTLDPYFWKVYGLGEMGILQGLIYQPPQLFEEYPPGLEIGYGLDFGFSNSKAALIKVGINRMNNNINEIYSEEIIYETGLTNEDLSIKFEEAGLNNFDQITADSAESKSIEDLARRGWNIHKADKSSGSVSFGIDLLKSCKHFVHKDSINLLKEYKNYKWKETRDGILLNEPVKHFDDALDAIRYDVTKRLNITETILENF